MDSFGVVLRQIRIEQNLRQSDLAQNGISRSLIGQYESGRRLPSYEMIQLLADRLNVSPSVFFNGHHDEQINRTIMTLVEQAGYAEKQSEWQKALDCWDSVLVLSRSFHINTCIVQAQWSKGVVLSKIERWQESIDILLPLLVQPDMNESLDSMFELLTILARCSRMLGHIHQCNTFLKIALHTISSTDIRWIRTQINIASELLMLDHFSEAAVTYRLAYEAAERVGEGLLESWARLGWTTAQLNLGKVEGVAEQLFKIERFYRLSQQQARNLGRRILHNQMMLFRLTGRYKEAAQLSKQCWLDLPRSPEEKAALLHETVLLASLTSDVQIDESSIEGVSEMTSIPTPLRTRLYFAISEYYLAMGKLDKAEFHFLQAWGYSAVSKSLETDRQLTLLESIRAKKGEPL